MDFLREQLRLLREFLGSGYRRTVLWCTLAMAGAAALGWVSAAGNPQAADQLVGQFMEMIEETGISDGAGNLSPLGLMANNWRAVLLPVLMGLIPFLFLPLMTLLSNGCLLGMLAPWAMGKGLSLGAYLAGILPHGIFELPALVLSAACGVYLCRNMGRMIFRSDRAEPLTELMSDLLRVMLLVVFPLVAAAAFLEAYVTPVVMSLFLGG